MRVKRSISVPCGSVELQLKMASMGGLVRKAVSEHVSYMSRMRKHRLPRFCFTHSQQPRIQTHAGGSSGKANII